MILLAHQTPTFIPARQFVAEANQAVRDATRRSVTTRIQSLMRSQHLDPAAKSDFLRTKGDPTGLIAVVNLDRESGDPNSYRRHWACFLIHRRNGHYTCELVPNPTEAGDDTFIYPQAARLAGNTLVVGAERGGADWDTPFAASFRWSRNGWHKESMAYPEGNVHDTISMKFVGNQTLESVYDVRTFRLGEWEGAGRLRFRSDWRYNAGHFVSGPAIEMPTRMGLLDKLMGYYLHHNRTAFNRRVFAPYRQAMWDLMPMTGLSFEGSEVTIADTHVEFTRIGGQMYIRRLTRAHR